MNNLLSPSTPFTKIILVRHARTTYNEQGRYQGSSDESVLTEQGHQDALFTGLALQQYNFDAIYTSPLTRVQQTTQVILGALKATNNLPPVFIEPKLTEISMSDWQGLFYQEVKENFAEDYSCWQNTPHLFTFNNTFFPVIELFKQAQQFWQKILTKHQGQTILVVAHGGTNRALISTAVGLNPEYYHSLQQSNCGISCLEFLPDNNFGELKYLNVTSHLGETLPKLKAGKTGWRWLLLSKANAKNIVKYSYVTRLINSNSIELLLTDHSVSKYPIEELAVQYKLPHLSLAQNHFLDWQQTIIKRPKHFVNSEQASLTTGLIIASDKLLAQILHTTLNINTLNITDHLAIIHYPQNYSYSILQGILPLMEVSSRKLTVNQ
ncbi:histidine phosphatase family protein [Pleurocapsa sp. CCALA 161]|uniref:histidine phosphatase family protein n=1 Tax=Pleurocapsa sp. CCALA 161 TaxID=2107688 RepID=UPI000D085C59|nr:histidine phosphatase family protein [Pleurocapsa sp. CCALA 161]PSB08604.1 histidine phosphatase family protein [Pleurocapsa sp. CCALA 161]